MESGTQLGHYTILSALGKGGMGEVWRARDTKLGREVAIKTLPEEFAKDADRVARFRREAQLLASLNHPNIAAIHGFEEDNDTHFLVLELVEGDTLADQLKRGAIPVEASLKLTLQIAEALEAAHEKGVIHRDLKPANVKVTPDGKVKVLDFGLAKAFAGDGSEVDISNSPTLSMQATQQGIILGTAAYMSPEQARGNAADLRSDIWAFGCVLFEMLTGRQTFEGGTVSDIMAGVLAKDPNWSSLPANLHPRIRFLLESCLEKESKSRCQGIAEARAYIQKALAEPGVVLTQPIPEAAKMPKPSALPWVAVIVLGIVVSGVSVWILKPPPPPEPRPISRSDYDLPEGHSLRGQGRAVMALSPDGSSFVYNTTDGLYLRRMDELEARLIPGTEEISRNPFFSPDGQWVGFHIGNQLQKIAISGGAPVGLGPANTNPFGISWGVDDMILFGQDNGIYRVSANGGTPELIIESESDERFTDPKLLRDDLILFSIVTGPGERDSAQIVVQSLESGERKNLWTGSDARYVPTGHLVYALDDDLFAVPFDMDTLEVTGGAVALVEGVVRAANTPSANYGISEDGSLVYLFGSTVSRSETLVWMDRQGNAEPLGAAARTYIFPRLSPDGQSVAVMSEGDIWLFDIARQTLTRLTFDEGPTTQPVWTPDGQYVAYRSIPEDDNILFWTRADGSGTEEQLTTGAPRQNPTSWSPDGQFLAFFKGPGVGGVADRDIWMMPLDGDREPRPFLETPFNELAAMFSPDGLWVAYVSDESGRNEVYVLPFPGPGGKRQISTEGGGHPQWARDGRELFYLNDLQMMAVDIETEPDFTVGTPTPLFEGGFVSRAGGPFPVYDVSADGQRFLMVQSASLIDSEAAPPQINIVLNWFEELKERVPVP